MSKKFFDYIIHGGDYNPEQWIKTPEIWDEDMRLMKLAHINSATVGIFSWAALEREEGIYSFDWLDTILDKMHQNGITAVLATPSGARPVWLADKYPEVLRTDENGIRNKFGERHNHCLTSPIYREKVQNINRLLAERYKKHPAVKMWHVSNEYSGECHCELCCEAFRNWLREYYHNDIEELNYKWWNAFWSHSYNSFDQINPPAANGENSTTGHYLAWKRFVTDSHISFFKNEIAPLREITPHIPVTTNFMRRYNGIDYQKFAQHVDLVSWDNYPAWDKGKNLDEALEAGFLHDFFRTLKSGQPFFLMESTPSLVNWHDVNKLPKSGIHELASIQAIAHGADSIQYFQWRKGRGGDEKFHGAVVDHCGHENTRVFRNVTQLGEILEKLKFTVGTETESKVAVIYDWENGWAVSSFCGYNNIHRDYVTECIKWYAPFYTRGINVDIISMKDDYTKYDTVIAPFLYMLKDGTEEKIEEYVRNGGRFVSTYLTGIVDSDDLCNLGGFPSGKLKDVFGVWCEETDSLPDDMPGKAEFNGKTYEVHHICDIIHSTGAKTLGKYKNDFYNGMPCVTENNYYKGKAYYAAFRNDNDFVDDFCKMLIESNSILPAADILHDKDVLLRKRGENIFIMNFADSEREIVFDKRYTDVITNNTVYGKVSLPVCGYIIIKQ